MMKYKVILLLLIVFTVQLTASNYIRDREKEKIIEDELEVIQPSMVEIFKTATNAMDKNNLVLADSLYSIVYLTAPTFDPLIRRLGTIRFQLGRVEEGINLCEKALTINKSAYNIISLATCYFYSEKNSENYKKNLGRAFQLLKEAESMPNGDEMDFPALIGQIALQENIITEFRTATMKLMSKYPKEMISHYYAAILATIDEDWAKANDEILIAEKMGLPKEVVQNFLDSGVQSKVIMRKYFNGFIWITSLWIIGLFLLFFVGKILSNFTIKSLENQESLKRNSVFEKGLRSVYRLLINTSGVYYYFSLPIVLVLVIALVAVLFYIFFLVGRIPIQLMLVIIVGSGYTIYGMVRSLLVKVKYSDVGRELTKEEAPGLFRLTTEVATTIGTRSIDEIRITPTTDLAVFERGSWKEKFQDKAKRILILGIGVLQDFKQDEFRAVLAHEYGHFSHRDTAGGEVAMRVRNDMNKYFYALYYAGQTVWWNIAFQFLRLYNLIFIRISHGSTRLQEVLADRVAAQTYGKKAFQNGLTYVIKRDIEFTKYASSEIEEAKSIQRPFNNLYGLTGNQNNEIEEELNKVLNRKTTEYDTHPSPVDRFRYISGIDAQLFPDNNSIIKDLFLNWDALTVEMTALIENGQRRV